MVAAQAATVRSNFWLDHHFKNEFQFSYFDLSQFKHPPQPSVVGVWRFVNQMFSKREKADSKKYLTQRSP
jgi:hypothetical protein